MSADIYAYTPGAEIPVYIEEDVNGDLPDRHDFVTITGETADYTVVQKAGDGDVALGQLRDFDKADDDGNVQEGAGTVVSGKPITWVPAGEPVEAGDVVMEGADGVVAFDGAVQDTPYGQVFATVAREFGVGEKVAIANHR